jgi:hypothetical protein
MFEIRELTGQQYRNTYATKVEPGAPESVNNGNRVVVSP